MNICSTRGRWVYWNQVALESSRYMYVRDMEMGIRLGQLEILQLH